jgi:hypothetical protein
MHTLCEQLTPVSRTAGPTDTARQLQQRLESRPQESVRQLLGRLLPCHAECMHTGMLLSTVHTQERAAEGAPELLAVSAALTHTCT